MKNIIIGTSGHIDHGKTTLIKHITGIDTDRLPEEKKRGMTIDIGFSFLEEEGRKIGIIDVPGHEKFIKNMVAGACGINYLILVIALDDGIMPQTREHFNISKLLGVQRGIIVLTKRDLVSADRVKEVLKEIEEEFKGSFLENSKIFETSINDTDSYEQVKEYLLKDTLNISKNSSSEMDFKMYVDRSFSVKGFGTVVTGSIYSGEVRVNDMLNLYPQNIKIKVKGIESHGMKIDKLDSGNRCALNIGNINSKDVKRGNLITNSSNLKPSNRIDIFFSPLKNKVLKNNQRIKLYVGTNEIIGRISFFKNNNFAQIKLEKETYLLEEDLGIIRNFSSSDTLGGIRVINLFGEKTKKDNINYMDKLKDRALGKKEEVFLLNKDKNIYISKKDLIIRMERLISFLNSSFEENNLLGGISKIEIKNRFFPEFENLEYRTLLEQDIFQENIEVNLTMINLKNRKVKLTKLQKEIKEKIFKIYKEGKFSPKNYQLIKKDFLEEEEFQRVHKYMFEKNMIVILNDNIFMLNGFFKESEKLILNYIMEHGRIELKECKELLGTNRESAILILEKLDKLRITIRDKQFRYANRRGIMKKVNAIGQICPMPVIMTKKALKEILTGEVEVLVDNETAKENVEKMVKEMGHTYVDSKEDNNFKITITKLEEKKKEETGEENIVVVLASDQMGDGDKELGDVLIKGFIYSLTEMENLPKTIVMYNKGVMLSTINENTVEDLKKLETMGVEILSCGTCVNYYHIQDKLKVGSLTNMYTIVERQMKATKILRV